MLTEPEQSTTNQQPPSLRDYVREGWKDLELDFQMYKDDLQRGYGDTKGAVKDVYRGTGRVAKGAFRSVKEDVSEQFQEFKADWSVQKTLVKQDLKDVWLAGRDWTSKVTARRQAQEQEQQQAEESQSGSSTASSHHDSTNDRNHDTTTTDPGETSMRQSKVQEIRDFEATLADPAFITELNSLIQSNLTSCPDLVAYYQERPELKEFTLTKELPRMKYTLFTVQGQKLTTPEEILEYARAHPDDHHQYDILWRAANQSIFGDVISTLTCDTGLVRPQFNTASFVDDVSVTLDLGRDNPHITAECFVNVTIPGFEGERLGLAGALVGVYFCPASSKMEARVIHISPIGAVTDEELEGAADNLMSHTTFSGRPS
jgi:hypothetical protein